MSEESAFPSVWKVDPMAIQQAKAAGLSCPTEVNRPGMTLRDYFAAKAMQPMLSRVLRHDDPSIVGDDWIALRAYVMADAMMKARLIHG